MTQLTNTEGTANAVRQDCLEYVGEMGRRCREFVGHRQEVLINLRRAIRDTCGLRIIRDKTGLSV